MLSDIAFVRIVAFRVGDGTAIAEVWQPTRIVVEHFKRHPIFIAGHAKNQVHRLVRRVVIHQRGQHRQERRDPGTARQKQERTLHRAQVEAAHRPTKRYGITHAGMLAKPGRHQPLRHITHHERGLRILRPGAKGVRARLVSAGHRYVDILPRQEAQCLPVV